MAVAAPAACADVVPIDVFGGVGDQHVVYPPYSSPDRYPPIVSVANVGDVNRDGRDDTGIVIESFEASYETSAWITFTPGQLPATSAAGEPGWDGFRIVGGQFNGPIVGVGDTNGDGLGDVAIADAYRNATFVVFGRTDGATVDVGSLGSAGFQIDNIAPPTGFGFGTTYNGSAWEDTTMLGTGDENGDGRPDIALSEPGAVKVVYTPANPAGATVDAANLGNGGFTLNTNGTNGPEGPYVADVGDLNGDGRHDLAVTWEDTANTTSYAVAALSPVPGTAVDLLHVADAGTGFELDLPDHHVENGVSLGDQNGDGVPDLGIVTFNWDGSSGRFMVAAYSPALGTRRTITPLAPGDGAIVDVYNGNVIDVGDQDGDGRDDIAYSDVVRLSSTGAVSPITPGTSTYLSNGTMVMTGVGGIIVAALRDQNGDGKREIVSVIADPYSDNPPYTATWMLNVYLSAPPPIVDSIEPPAPANGLLDFSGTFVTDPAGGMRSLAALPSVQLTGPTGAAATVSASKAVDANGERTTASVDVDPRSAGLVPGATYSYRMQLANNRGTAALSDAHSFVYTPPPGTAPPPAPVPVPVPVVHRALVNVVRGTARADVLIGGPGRDLMFGLGGNDVLRGLGGADRLYGGPGADRLIGGPGRDRLYGGPGNDRIDARDGAVDHVDCGRGRDRVRADRRDHVARDCERVKRY